MDTEKEEGQAGLGLPAVSAGRHMELFPKDTEKSAGAAKTRIQSDLCHGQFRGA